MSEHEDARLARAIARAWGRPELGSEERARFDARLAERLERVERRAPRRMLLGGVALAAAAAAVAVAVRFAPPAAMRHPPATPAQASGSDPTAIDRWAMAGLSPDGAGDGLEGLLPSDYLALAELVAVPAAGDSGSEQAD